MSKAKIAIHKISSQIPDADLKPLELDLNSFFSINQFAIDFAHKYSKLDLIIANAGIMAPPFSKTENGFESQFGINFLGHFLLINLLFPFLLKSDAARVITLGSLAHKKGKIDFNNLNAERSYSKWNAYSQSKLACIMFAYELDRRIKQHGLPVKSVSAHPGFSQTNLAHSSPTLIKSVFNPAADLIGQGAVEGSLPILMAALSSNVAGGEYFGPTGFMEVRGEPGIVKSSTYSHDEKDAQKLWEKSEELTGRTFSVVR